MIAIRRLQQIAGAQAGAMIVRTEELDHESYHETIEVVSAAVVRLLSMKERIILIRDEPVMVITADAVVDLSDIVERVSYLKENKKLRSILSDLSNRYISAMSSDLLEVPYPLIWEYEGTISRWLSDDEFSGLVKHNLAALIKAKRFLVENVLVPLKESEISGNIESITEDNSNYFVSVNINFDFNDAEINGALSEFWETRNRRNSNHPFILISKNFPKKDVLPRYVLDELFLFLSSKSLELKISVAGVSKYIPITYFGNDFRGGCNVTKPEFYSKVFCISKINSNTNRPLNTSYFENPVVLVISKSKVIDFKGKEIVVRLVNVKS